MRTRLLRILLINLSVLLLPAGLVGQTYLTPTQLNSKPIVVKDSLVRPTNSTDYAANDAVNDNDSTKVLVFTGAAWAKGGTGIITGAKLFIDTANTANASFSLYIFNARPLPTTDNAQFKMLAAYNNILVGVIDFNTLQTGGTGSTSAFDVQTNWNHEFRTTSDSKDLYGILVAKAAFKPKHNMVATAELKIIRY